MDYDLAGNLAWSAAGLALPNISCDTTTAYNSGRRVDRTYDTRNRLATLRFPDGNGNQDWYYYATGRPQQVITQNGGVPVTNLYEYHRRGLPLAAKTGVKNRGHSTFSVRLRGRPGCPMSVRRASWRAICSWNRLDPKARCRWTYSRIESSSCAGTPCMTSSR